MRLLLTLIPAFALFSYLPSQSEARGHGQRGERRVVQRVKNILPHPLQRLKDRRAERRG